MSRTALRALRRSADALLGTLSSAGLTTAGSPVPAVLADGGDRRGEDDDHLRDVPDGAGCTEIWEYLSEHHAGEGETQVTGTAGDPSAGDPSAAEGKCDD